jgi:high-affinity iron transporter
MRPIRIYESLPGLLVLALLSVAPYARAADDASPLVQQTWRILDYVAADYAGAVKDGNVLSAAEYTEMREFVATAGINIASLPATPQRAALEDQAQALVREVEAKAKSEEVSALAHALADALLATYPVPAALADPPDIAAGEHLFAVHCAACHGTLGRGDGPAGSQLEPRPVDFTDQVRADQRSALSLYDAITSGVKGTSMLGYTQLPASDRWALAFYVGTLAYHQDSANAVQLWEHNRAARSLISTPEDLARARASAWATTLGADQARALIGYLRAHPSLAWQSLRGIAFARASVAASLRAYVAGARPEAAQLALAAYLDGVEPVEPRLNARDSAVRAQIESAMAEYRSSLAQGAAVADLTRQAEAVDALLARAEQALESTGGDPTSTFVGAFTVLVREGLEALLIVVALLAFLDKAGRREGMRYVHAGWFLALAAGVVTWAVARYAISVSGAGRELTEGLSSLFAVGVLIIVGLWMHQRSIGDRWQAFFREKMTTALERRSAWFLFGLAFVSVYREVFETILFAIALWSEGQGMWLLLGLLVGAVALGAIAWILLRTSRRLPMGTFFSASSAVIAILAVVLTGKGIAALQEAGVIGVNTVSVPRIELLGLYPTRQSLLAQLAVVIVLALGFGLNAARARSTAST